MMGPGRTGKSDKGFSCRKTRNESGSAGEEKSVTSSAREVEIHAGRQYRQPRR